MLDNLLEQRLELQQRLVEQQNKINDIGQQLDAAAMRKSVYKEHADPEWFQRAQFARKEAIKELRNLQHALSVINLDIRRAKAEAQPAIVEGQKQRTAEKFAALLAVCKEANKLGSGPAGLVNALRRLDAVMPGWKSVGETGPLNKP